MNRNSFRLSNSNEFMYVPPRKRDKKFSPRTVAKTTSPGVSSPYYTVSRTPQQEADADQYRLKKGLRKR
jgi:hypothetical protein